MVGLRADIEAGSLELGGDSPVPEAGNPAGEDIPVVQVDSPVAEVGNPAVGDNLQAEVGTPVAVEDSPAEVDTRVGVDNRQVEVGNPAAVEVGNSLPPGAVRRRQECRTWGKKCCPGLKVCRSWGSRMRAEYRMRYRISGRGRYWRRTWGILSIVAYYLSITSAKLSNMITLISKLCLIVFLIIYSSIK
jgi:hypothetical protein